MNRSAGASISQKSEPTLSVGERAAFWRISRPGKTAKVVGRKSLIFAYRMKKFKITNIDSTLLRSVSDLDRGQPSTCVKKH